jgi:hypothetical protein
MLLAALHTVFISGELTTSVAGMFVNSSRRSKMAIFGDRFYNGRDDTACDIDGYRQALEDALKSCLSESDREQTLRDEAIEITRHIISGIRDIIKKDRNVRDLVLNKGAIPLATWTDYLDQLSHQSLYRLRDKINEMQHELEQGKIGGFPGTMFLYNKPTFVTFEAFYKTIFELAGMKRTS